MMRYFSGLFAFMLFSSTVYAEETLQSLTTVFRHEQETDKVKDALLLLSHAQLQPLGLPCNDLGCHERRLDVENLDDLLLSLGKLWQQHPQYRVSIERVLLRWNFCDVNYLNVPHNLMQSGASQLIKKQAVGRAKAWAGLRLWGFTENDPDNRIQAELLTRSNLGSHAKRQLLYKVERKQCFPNPWTGQTPYDPETLPYDTFYRHAPQEPILWLKEKVKTIRLQEQSTADSKVHEKNKQKSKPKHTQKKQPKSKAINHHGLHQKFQARYAELPKASAYHVVHATAHTTLPLMAYQLHMAALAHRGTAPISLRLSPKSLKMVENISDFSSKKALRWVESISAFPKNNEDIASETSDKLMSNGMFFTRSLIHGYDNYPLPKGPNVGLAGDMQLRWRLKDNSYAFNTSVQWSPYKHFYIRSGLRIPLTGISHTPTYTWGLGYADWAPGGFSLGWNQWTPQSINTPPSIKNMEFKFGYNLSLIKLLGLPKRYQSNLSFSFSQGVPALHNDWQYNFGDGWFARAGISKLFARNKLYNRNDWGWTYGFGRSKWQAGSFNIEYANWGFNRIPQDNFRVNGEVIASWRWKLP